MREKIIIDTDLGADCDDAGAVALACILQQVGEVELLGIGHNTANRAGIEATDVICRYYGCEVPLGSCKTATPNPSDGFAKKLVDKFGARTRFENTPEAVSFYRRLLSQNKGVKLVGIGQANNLSALLASSADEIGPCGRQLIAESVSEVVWMAGMFRDEDFSLTKCTEFGAEYNVQTDIPSARYFAENCPVPITFADFVLGRAVKTLGQGDGSDPVSFAYKTFCGGERESWDLLAVLYAVFGEKFFRRISGRITIDEEGVTYYTAEEKDCKDGYLRPRYGYGNLKDEINRIFGLGGKKCINI